LLENGLFSPHPVVPACNLCCVVAILSENKRPTEGKRVSSNLVLIAVIILVAIIAVALLRPGVRWLLAEWHAAKSRNYPNRLQ
jgi:hypothetical protein